MEKDEASKSSGPVDQNVKDITVCLRNNEGIHRLFVFKSSILKSKSKFFTNQLSLPSSSSCIEIHCSVVEYKHYIDLLNLLYLPIGSLVDSWKSINSALGILQVAVALQCEEIAQSCVNYLEAVPWEQNEEEEILRIVPKLGDVAMPILARVKPPDPSSTKNVFLAAIRYAMSISAPCPPFGDEIQASAQEQIEYMLGEDEDTPLVTTDQEVREEVIRGISQMLTSFQDELYSLLSESDLASTTTTTNPSIVPLMQDLEGSRCKQSSPHAEDNLTLETLENNVLHNLSGLDWLCNILPKMNLMGDLVSKWVEISPDVIRAVEDKKLETVMWKLKLKLLEVTSKVLDAVGYGSVILPATTRVQLLKTWLPYIQKMKPILDSVGDNEMDEDLSQGIQGAIVAIIVALPSSDQADILADWMENEQLDYPDLTEAFEIWCYRTKSSKRRLAEGLDRVSNSSASDLSN